MTGQSRHLQILKLYFRTLRRGRRDERGTVAVIFALSVIPLVAMMGLSIEYSRASSMRAAMQQYADAAALNAGVGKLANVKLAEKNGNLDANTNTDPFNSLKEVLAQFENNYPSQFSSFDIGTRWRSESEFEITMRASMRPVSFSMVGDLDVDILTIAKIINYQKPQKKPELVFLDFEAADYNRLYVYCFEKFDKTKPASQQKPLSERRRNFTAISDNGGTKYTIKMPECNSKESLSIMLHNVENARTTKSLWERNPKLYYSDTEDNNNQTAQQYDFGGRKMVETVICNNLAECKPTTKGGIIPFGKNRTPVENTKPCAPGKYIYHGFEDRPGTGDRDFDDITMVMECPRVEIATRVVLAR